MDIENRVSKFKSDLDFARQTIADLKAENRKRKQKAADIEEALDICLHVTNGIQNTLHTEISKLVTHCLRYVFQDTYEFQIVFDRKRGRTSAKIVFKKDGQAFSPLDSTGGGIVDVTSFSLRLAAIMLRRPKVERILVLDEPFKFVSKNFLPRARELIEELSSSHGFQFIIVTHLDELKTGNVIEL